MRCHDKFGNLRYKRGVIEWSGENRWDCCGCAKNTCINGVKEKHLPCSPIKKIDFELSK